MPLKHPKAKGTRLEKEVVAAFKDASYDAERMWGSNGQSRGLHNEVDVLVNGTYKIQCKFVKSLGERYKPSEHVHATVFRENRGDMYIMLKLDDFLKGYKIS